MSSESIYDLIPKPEEQKEKGPRYVSKYSPDIPPTSSTFGQSHAAQHVVTNASGDLDIPMRPHRHRLEKGTFGPGENTTSDPNLFLTKHSQPSLPPPQKHGSKLKTKRKPNVVKKSEKPLMGLRSNKNFIHDNAVNNILSEPKTAKPEPKRYATKSDFGKVPDYLGDVKTQIEVEKNYVQELLDQEKKEESKTQGKMRLLPEDEREKLLASLKSRWEQVNHQYQGMTHMVVIDTNGKMRRKEEYEQQLHQLEKSMEQLSKKYSQEREKRFTKDEFKKNEAKQGASDS